MGGQNPALSRPRRARSVTVKFGESFDWSSLAGWTVQTAWTFGDGAVYMIVQQDRAVPVLPIRFARETPGV